MGADDRHSESRPGTRSRGPAENRSRVLGAPRVQWGAGNEAAISDPPIADSLLVVLPTLLATSVSFVAVRSSFLAAPPPTLLLLSYCPS